MRLSFFCLLFMLCAICSYAQDDLEFGDTGTTNTAPKYKPNNRNFRQKRLIQWIKNDTKGLLLGNKCMEEATTAMGFEYLVQPRGKAGNRSELGRQLYNLPAKIKITFKNGPFWKFKLKKKRKECRKSTGDYVG